MSIFRKPKVTEYETGIAFTNPYIRLETMIEREFGPKPEDRLCYNRWFEDLRIEPREGGVLVCGTYVLENKCASKDGGQWQPGKPRRYKFSAAAQHECPCPIAKEKDALGADAR